MPHINLNHVAEKLPSFWQSKILGQSGNCNIKILKMDAQQYPDETHDYNEALIVISGKMFLIVEGQQIQVSEGEMYLAPAGVAHSVAQGSYGTLMIIDPIAS